MFQIVCIAPSYHAFTDAIIGSTQHRLPMAYLSATLAEKIAGRLSAKEYENCGDDYFVVVPYGESAFTSRLPAPCIAPDDFMPF